MNVWQHSLDAAEAKLGTVSAFLDLDCTSPLREDADIDNALALFQSQAPDMVMSCCDARKNPYFNLVGLVKQDLSKFRLAWKCGSTPTGTDRI